jgi:hypothetical protein
MLKYFTLPLVFSATLALAQNRKYDNPNVNGNLSFCVNDGGVKNSCPIVITGSTSGVSISNLSTSNAMTVNGNLTTTTLDVSSAVTSDLVIPSDSIHIGTGTLGTEDILIGDASQPLLKLKETANSVDFQIGVTNANGPVIMTTTDHSLALGTDNYRRLLIDRDGNAHYRSTDTLDTQDFGHIPLTITGASTWTPALNTGTSGSPNATVMIGPQDGTNAGTSSIIFDTGFIPGGFRFKVDSSDFDLTFEHATGTNTYVEDFEIDSTTGESSLKVRDDGTTSTSNQGCNGITGNNICSGNYTAVVTETAAPCDLTPSNPTGYFRIGDKVHVYGALTVKSGKSCHQTGGLFTLSVPITNGVNFSSDNEVGGTFKCITAGNSGGAIEQDNSSDVVEFNFEGTDTCTSNDTVRYEFTYEIP